MMGTDADRQPSLAPGSPAVPLSSLPCGTCATLHERLLGSADCELLSAMGMTERCRLRVCRIGNPCIVEVASTRLGLSLAMARCIMVFPEQRHQPASAVE